MLRKMMRLFRNIIIGVLWTYVFFAVANVLFYTLWNFNFLYSRSWETIAAFWQAGGTIKTSKDYIFLLALLSLPFLWLWGWRRVTQINYIDFFLYPLIAYNRHIINKYGHDSSHIVLKNLKSSQHQIELVKQQLESIKPEKPQEVNNIRDNIQKKIESSQN